MQHLRTTVLASLAATLLIGSAHAGGGEDCANADVLAAGALVEAFDTTLAVDEGVYVSCGLGANVDVWYEWTPDVNGQWIFSTCNAASYDTRLTLWSGCAGAELGCNDDGVGCAGFSSELSVFGLNAGTSYFMQVGGYNGAVGTGTLDISMFTPPTPTLNPANGHYYLAVLGNVDWDTAKAQAEGQSHMGQQGHLVTLQDAAEKDFCLTLGIDRPWIGAFHDFSDPNYLEPDQGWAWVTGEPFTYTNWFPGEPNNAGPGGIPEDHAEMFGSGEWNDIQAQNGVNQGYIIEYDTVGGNYCTSAVNSTGSASIISSFGSSSIAQNNLGFRAGPMAVGEPGIFYYGPDQIMVPFGDGNRCVGGSAGTIVRMFPFAQADGAGEMSYVVDNTAAVHVQIVPGATLNVQAWFRDPAAGMSGFNLSDGLEVTFAP